MGATLGCMSTSVLKMRDIPGTTLIRSQHQILVSWCHLGDTECLDKETSLSKKIKLYLAHVISLVVAKVVVACTHF